MDLPYPSATPPKPPYVLKGIRISSLEHAKIQRLPVTPALLSSIHSLRSKQPITFDKTMLWAAFCTGLFGFMRAGEFTVTSEHIAVPGVNRSYSGLPPQPPSHIVTSKTQYDGQASKKCTYFFCRIQSLLCPVSTLLPYMAIRPQTPGPLFIFQGGVPSSGNCL